MSAQICTHCVLSSLDDSKITFNENGVCNYCTSAIIKQPIDEVSNHAYLDEVVKRVKQAGKENEYDCLIGLSGGVDSSYLVYQAVQLGLRPLIVHYDNGWNSELAVMNIENILKKLHLDLVTIVNDWSEFKNLQRSFFKANVIDIEMITDQAIMATQYYFASKFNIKYILSGSNKATESILPNSWYHTKMDVLNIKSIHKRYGNVPLKTYPMLGYFRAIYVRRVKKITVINLLNYLPYDKDEAKRIIIEKIGWRDYGGKHFESIFTRFYQAYILPKKFHVDKRKAHLASLICSGQISRDQAFDELKKPIYDSEKLIEDKEYVLKKLGFSEKEFNEYVMAPAINHLSYPSYHTRHYKFELFAFWLIRPFTRIYRKFNPKSM